MAAFATLTAVVTAAALLLGSGAAVAPDDARADGRFEVGVDLASGFYEPTAIDDFERTIDRRVDVVQAFVSWGYTQDPTWNRFPAARVRQILARGSTPELTWVPTVTGGPTEQPEMNLTAIARGDHDAYVRSFARDAAAVGRPVYLRFGHEMNGAWAPYAETRSGNQRGDFVRAWRHVHEVFAAEGATNVRWMWSPNIVDGADNLAGYFPGDGYVDIAALDGYAYPTAGCRSASRIFDDSLRQLRALTSRPIVLAEVAAASQCANRAAWLAGFFGWLTEQPDIRGFTWWQRTESGRDWRLNSSPADLEAFKRGLADLERHRAAGSAVSDTGSSASTSPSAASAATSPAGIVPGTSAAATPPAANGGAVGTPASSATARPTAALGPPAQREDGDWSRTPACASTVTVFRRPPHRVAWARATVGGRPERLRRSAGRWTVRLDARRHRVDGSGRVRVVVAYRPRGERTKTHRVRAKVCSRPRR